jgi:hypothetical protein
VVVSFAVPVGQDCRCCVLVLPFELLLFPPVVLVTMKKCMYLNDEALRLALDRRLDDIAC